jgi:hypothetical protein
MLLSLLLPLYHHTARVDQPAHLNLREALDVIMDEVLVNLSDQDPLSGVVLYVIFVVLVFLVELVRVVLAETAATIGLPRRPLIV